MSDRVFAFIFAAAIASVGYASDGEAGFVFDGDFQKIRGLDRTLFYSDVQVGGEAFVSLDGFCVEDGRLFLDASSELVNADVATINLRAAKTSETSIDLRSVAGVSTDARDMLQWLADWGNLHTCSSIQSKSPYETNFMTVVSIDGHQSFKELLRDTMNLQPNLPEGAQ